MRNQRQGGAACGLAAAMLALALPARTAPQRHPPSFAGTWKATDAVDDYERAAVITIRAKKGGYELVDPTFHPTFVLRGKVSGHKLTFVRKHGNRATRYTYTLSKSGSALTEDQYDGVQHLGIHYLREGRRPNPDRSRRHHSFAPRGPSTRMGAVWAACAPAAPVHSSSAT